jgi:hypothetical protein
MQHQPALHLRLLHAIVSALLMARLPLRQLPALTWFALGQLRLRLLPRAVRRPMLRQYTLAALTLPAL